MTASHKHYNDIMKIFDTNKYISEKLGIKPIGKTTMSDYKRKFEKYKYFPKTRSELDEILYTRIVNEGWKCDLNDIDVSRIEDMSKLFSAHYDKFNGDISEWDVSNVWNMEGMFKENIYFDGDLSKWKVHNVMNMSCMFFGSAFNGDISKWNVKNVMDMTHMFCNSNFNGDLSKWNVSKVVDMTYMFYGAGKFNGDISRWNVSNVNNMSWMFAFSVFDGNISKWDVSNVTNMEGMFKESQFNGNISDWDVSNVENMTYMFYGAEKFKGDLSRWNVKSLRMSYDMFCYLPSEYIKPYWYKALNKF